LITLFVAKDENISKFKGCLPKIGMNWGLLLEKKRRL